MRHYLEAQRLRNLGAFPSAEAIRDTSPIKLPARPASHDPSQEPSADLRRARPEIFMGNTFAEEVLTALDLSFHKIDQSYRTSFKPALDVGASCSTVAIEGTLRGIQIHATDLRYNKTRVGTLFNIQNRALLLGKYYQEGHKLPPGFSCHPIPETAWEECVKQGIKLVDSRMVECKASDILLPNGGKAPDRYFSTVFSHHAVPKYSARDVFLNTELKELLRVTDERLVIFPLVTAGPGDPLIHIPGSEGHNRLRMVAQEAGFSLEIKPSPITIGGA